MTTAEFNQSAAHRSRGSRIFGSLRAWLDETGDRSLAQRAAGTAFLIRVAGAGAVFLSQIALARWMGRAEFGIYVYVWTWVSLIGEITHLGLPLAAQRLIPEYSAPGTADALRGFIVGSRYVVLAGAGVAMLLAIAAVYLSQPWLDSQQVAPLYLACLALPFFSLSILLDGTARAYNWIAVAVAPLFLWRPLLVLALMAAAHLGGLPANATSAMAAVVIAAAATVAVQVVIIDRRLRKVVKPGPRRYDVKKWLATSLPIVLVWGFYTLLTYTDVLVLQQFHPPEEVGLYFAAARTLLLVTFVYFAVAAAVTHRFSAYHLAGDRARLAALVANAVRWTFWPSLAATLIILGLGKPLLWLFGPDFVAGYPLMFILAIGLLARSSIGPAERLLSMLGQQRICALIYGGAFLINLGGSIALVPAYGAAGAAIAVSAAIMFETAALFAAVKAKLGLDVFVFNCARRRQMLTSEEHSP